MILGYMAQSVWFGEMEQKMLPNERWGSCHEVTEGAALRSNAGTEGIFNSSLLTPNSSLPSGRGIL